MEKRQISVVRSEEYYKDVQDIFDYGTEVFGIPTADAFIEDLIYKVECLSFQYQLHPECRHIITKSHMYRNIILASYLIIYRITPDQIEVLRAFSSRMSITKIRSARSIKI
jgi:plasmid stabilization system protein ParE